MSKRNEKKKTPQVEPIEASGMRRVAVNQEIHVYRNKQTLLVEIRKESGKPAVVPWVKVAAGMSKSEALTLAIELLSYAANKSH